MLVRAAMCRVLLLLAICAVCCYTTIGDILMCVYSMGS